MCLFPHHLPPEIASSGGGCFPTDFYCLDLPNFQQAEALDVTCVSETISPALENNLIPSLWLQQYSRVNLKENITKTISKLCGIFRLFFSN
jgi:hypothetical protein